jgi:putative pyruvate formate lyase activating enzyme
MVSSFSPHFGEEEPLVGRGGSGTIFLTSCNLRCVFCQNYDISHRMEGEEVEAKDLAAMMLRLQALGCHNINFVTPTHQVPQILEALALAAGQGLRLPLVYNCGGYEAVATLRLLDGIVDIYMPDFKFADSEAAATYADAPDYPDVARAAIREMHRQVGDLVLDEHGIAQRGLLVRHLVMPNGLAGTRKVMRFLAQEISRNTYVNVMAQYRPCGLAHRHPAIARGITATEYREAVEAALEEGIHRLDERHTLRILFPAWDL